MDVVIHAGMPKTGTTSLQSALAANRLALGRQGVLVPDLNVQNLLGVITRDFADLPRPLRHRLATQEELETARSEAMEVLQGLLHGGGERLVLSSEYIYGADAAGLARLGAALKGATRITCLFYVRSAASFYMAGLQQRARASGELLTPAAFLEDTVPSDFRYHPLAFVESCGKALTERLEVCCYDRELFEQGDIRRDFWQRAGLDEAMLGDGETPHENRALAAEEVKLLLEYRRRHHPRRLDDVLIPHSTMLMDSLPGRGTPVVLQGGLAAWIDNARRGEIEALRDRFRIVFRDVDYDFPGGSDAWKSRDLKIEDIITVDAERFTALSMALIHAMLSDRLRRLQDGAQKA